MTKEITTILKNIQDEQVRIRKIVERIESDLGTDRTDIDNLKSEVAGMTDKIGRFSGQLVKFKEKIGEDVQDAVNEGIKPVGDVLNDLSDGVSDGSIPVTTKAAKNIKTNNWVTKFVRKWNTHTLTGKKK